MRFKYLPEELKDLEVGLKKLDFENNFSSFEVTVTIPATSELKIENTLRTGKIPSKRLIVRQTGGGAIIDGTSAWTKDALYLYNTGASPATVTVIFLE